MIKTLSIIIILIIPVFLIAQLDYKIKGQIITPEVFQPIGNIIALNPVDSSFISGNSFYDTHFEISIHNAKNVLIKITSLQFDDHYILVNYSGQALINLGDVYVQNTGIALDEIVVKTSRPKFLQRANGTIEVFVENTSLSSNNSVSEILRKSPEIIADETGNLSIFGKGNAIIYLNGKRITNSQLSLVFPSNLKKIEIIRNPSSKYDAQGGAVINLKTITQLSNGYQVKIKQNLSNSNFGGFISNSDLNFNYKFNKFSTKAHYNLQLGKSKELLHTTRDRILEDDFLTTDLTTEWNYGFDNYSHYSLGMQYEIDSNSNLSFAYAGYSENLGGDTKSHNSIRDETETSHYDSDMNVDEKYLNHSFSLNYNKVMDTLGSNLFIGGQYAQFDVGANNHIKEESKSPSSNSNRFLKNIHDLKNGISSGQLDYKKVFRKNKTIELGTKYSHITNDFMFDFLTSSDGTIYITDNSLSNTFNYKESIAAVYINFKSALSKDINFSIGTRIENTKYELNLSQNNGNLIHSSYLNIFPNLSITKKLSDQNSIHFSYTARINRPPYQRLNPILIYQDPYTSVQGNTQLRPQKTHAFEINTKIWNAIFRAGYNYTIDPFGQTAIRGSDSKSYILKRINYGHKHEFFTSINTSFTVRWWTTNNSLNLKYTKITEDQFDFKIIESKPNFNLYSNNKFQITNSLKADLLIRYYGNNYEGLHLRRNRYDITVNLEKSFFNNNLKIRLIANDIFHTNIASGNYNVGQTEVYYNRRWSTDYYKLSILYNFGKLKKITYRNKSIGKSEQDRT